MHITPNMKAGQRVFYALGGVFLIVLPLVRELSPALRIGCFAVGAVSLLQAAVGF